MTDSNINPNLRDASLDRGFPLSMTAENQQRVVAARQRLRFHLNTNPEGGTYEQYAADVALVGAHQYESAAARDEELRPNASWPFKGPNAVVSDEALQAAKITAEDWGLITASAWHDLRADYTAAKRDMTGAADGFWRMLTGDFENTVITGQWVAQNANFATQGAASAEALKNGYTKTIAFTEGLFQNVRQMTGGASDAPAASTPAAVEAPEEGSGWDAFLKNLGKWWDDTVGKTNGGTPGRVAGAALGGVATLFVAGLFGSGIGMVIMAALLLSVGVMMGAKFFGGLFNEWLGDGDTPAAPPGVVQPQTDFGRSIDAVARGTGVPRVDASNVVTVSFGDGPVWTPRGDPNVRYGQERK